MLHISPTNYHLIAAKQAPYEKAYHLAKSIEEFSRKSFRMGQKAEKRRGRKSKGSRQKNKRWDIKVESNDSPEIPNRWETSENPRLP